MSTAVRSRRVAVELLQGHHEESLVPGSACGVLRSVWKRKGVPGSAEGFRRCHEVLCRLCV